MNKIMLLSAFSLNSLPNLPVNVYIKEISKQETISILNQRGFISQIAHSSTADVLSEQLKMKIDFHRETLTFTQDTEFIVAQVTIQKRLQEGQVLTKEEMESCPVRYLYITLKF